MRGLLLAAVLALGLPACASLPPSGPASSEDAGAEEGTSAFDVGHVILMYIPNRVVDLFDVVRVGVNVGPGVGAQVKATEAAQAEFMSRLSAGVGIESLRHLPAYAGAESAIGVGPVEGGGTAGIGWYQSKTDFRVEVHPFLAGAHVAIDPVEIADFLLGFLTIDIRHDDH